MSRPHHLDRGAWVVLATPFDEDLALDVPSLVQQVRSLDGPDVTGLVALGVFGEAAALRQDEMVDVLVTVLECTDKPVVVGLPGTDLDAVVADARMLLDVAERPPAAFMVQVPSADPGESTAHLRAVHEATGRPLVVQDYPVASGVTITTADLTEVVTALADVVAAVKSEAPPTSAAIAELTEQVDTPVFGGLGGVGLLDELAAGAAGAMTGFSHPEAMAHTVVAHAHGGDHAARLAWTPWLPLATFEGQARIGLAIRKEVLRRRGIIASAGVRPPAAPLPERLLPHVDRHLATVPTP